jgi:nitroreductase/NAD-dependent dihydropyrimidine dehydrogenase PreA subunit
MSKPSSFVNHESCTGCKTCIEVCPNALLEINDTKKAQFTPYATTLCIVCGQCMMVCPHEAVHINGLDYARDFNPLPPDKPNAEVFTNIIRTRRSLRSFKSDPVPDEILEQLVTMISYAPPSFPPHKVEVTVVKDRSVLAQSIPIFFELYSKLGNWLKNPFMRFFIKRNIPPAVFITLTEHILPLIPMMEEQYKAHSRNKIFYDAPVLLLFHAHKLAPEHTPDSYIDMTYAWLAAHSLNLGAIAIGLLPFPINRDKRLRKLFQIPDENEVIIGLGVGYHQTKYRRTIKRSLAKVTWIK